MKSSVCIEMIFTALPFLERIKLAADTGFDAIEFWNWDNKDMPAIKATAEQAGIQILTFQSNRGGTLVNPHQRSDFVAGIKESLQQAMGMNVKNLFLLTDELGPDRSVVYQFPELSEEEKYHSVLAGLKELARLAEEAAVTLNLEPLNTKIDHPGYWLNHAGLGFDLVREVSSPNLRLLFDCYHVQIMDGDFISLLVDNIDLVGHVHVADTQGRHEPGTGEINYGEVFEALRTVGYDRYVGLEFEPTGDAVEAVRDVLKLMKS